MKPTINQFVFLFSFGFTLTSCVLNLNGSSTTNSVERKLGMPDPIDCGADGTQMSYQPTARFGVDRSEVGLKGDFKLRGQNLENDPNGYMIDLCLDNATFEVSLARLIRRLPAMSAFNTYHLELLTEQKLPSIIWEDMISESKMKDISLTFINDKDPKKSYFLKGWTSKNGLDFVTMSNFDAESGDEFTSSTDQVMYGVFTEGNPWTAKYHQHNRVIVSEGLRIELYYKMRRGNNNYKSYRVEKVVVTDTSPKLSEALNITLVPEKGNEYFKRESKFFKIKYTHHSLLDQFIIDLGDVKYTIGLGLLTEYNGDAIKRDFECGEVSNCGEELH